MSTQTFADVAEGVRNTLAAYTQALDDGRVDDLVATFCPDGSFDLPGLGHYAGHEAMRAAFGGYRPGRPQRHLVLNTHITDWDGDEARATSDVVLLLKDESGWGVRIVGRYQDVLHRDEGTWRFHFRQAEFVS